MGQVIEAVYRKGILHPLEPVEGLQENARVLLTIESVAPETHALERFAGILSAEEADEMLRLIEEEFERVDPDAW